MRHAVGVPGALTPVHLCGTTTGRALTLRAGRQGQDGRQRNTGNKPPPGLLSHRFAVYNGAAFCSPSAALTSRSLGAAEIPRLPPKATEVGAMRTALGVTESTAAPKSVPTRRILFCKYNKRTQSKHVQLDQRLRMIAETRKRGSRAVCAGHCSEATIAETFHIISAVSASHSTHVMHIIMRCNPSEALGF